MNGEGREAVLEDGTDGDLEAGGGRGAGGDRARGSVVPGTDRDGYQDETARDTGSDRSVTYLVAFDGTAASREALRSATRFVDRADACLVVVSVLPTDAPLAAEYGLADGTDGEYDPDRVARRLGAAVADLAPRAEFRTERVDDYAGRRRIALEIRRAARAVDADLVFVGTDAVGRVLEELVQMDDEEIDATERYDLVVVRST